jgi:ComF family protein
MLDIFTKFLDFIAPRDESVRLVETLSLSEFTTHLSCLQVQDTLALASYHTPHIHAAIVANKFHNSQKAATLLASLLEAWLIQQPKQKIYLVPIPLGPKRQRERGYNQVERVLAALDSDIYEVLPLLYRPHDTPPQTSLHRADRLRNMQNAFVVDRDKIPSKPGLIIICDDVITTGATLTAAKAALVPHLPTGFTIRLVALAH